MRVAFRPLENYPGYEINRMGLIRNSVNGSTLKPTRNSEGYPCVTLNGKTVKAHILVAKTFIPNPDDLPVVNHKKGDKLDSRASQLEWCSYSDNLKHAWDTGLRAKKKRR